MKNFKKGRKSRKSEFQDKIARSDMPAKSDQNNNKIPRKTKKPKNAAWKRRIFAQKEKVRHCLLTHLWPLEVLKPLLEQSPVDPDR